MKSEAGSVVSLYALLALLVVPVFPHFPSPNELSRWVVAASIVERGSLEVSPLLPLLGGQFEDLAEVNGRVYSNKAPGGALVGLPGYAIARLFFGPPSPASIRPTLTAMRLLSATLPAILLALLLARAAARFGASDRRIAVALVALLFGTPLFAYGLLNFSHALAAFALFGAWTLLFIEPSSRRDFAAGALIGLAVLSEYPCAIAGAVLIAFAGRRALRVIAGGLPFALVLAIYNKLAFGTVLALSSGHERNEQFRELAGRGLFGIGIPSFETLLHLLVDPSKGLFVFSPVLVAALLAIPRARRALSGPAFGALVGVPLALLVLYAGYPNWHGGWTVGARYLVPALPFLLLPLVFGEPGLSGRAISQPSGNEVRAGELVLLGASVLATVLTTLVFPFVPGDFPLPWMTFAWPLLRDGLVAPNALHYVSRVLAIGVPFALVITAVVVATRRRAALVAIGVVLAIAAGFFVRLSPVAPLERAYLEEVCFDRVGTLERFGHAPPALIRRAEAQRRLPPTPWPF